MIFSRLGVFVMLVNFRFENYLSFDKLSSFSLVPGKSRRHKEDLIELNRKQNLLKFSAIYGANASGKTSFIDAIGISKFLICFGFNERIALSDKYNKNNKNNSLKETKFEYEIVVENRIYSYGFSVILSLKKFTSEWLYDITDNEEYIYEIDRSSSTYRVNETLLNLDDNSQNRLSIYIQDSVSDSTQLFLSSLNDGKKVIESKEKNTIFKKVFNWFSNTLEVLGPNDEAKDSYASITQKSQEFKEKLGEYLELNDTGVVDIIPIEVKNISNVPAKIQERILEKIYTDFEKKKNPLRKKNMEINTLLNTSRNLYLIRIKQNQDDELPNFEYFEYKFQHKNGTLYSLEEESDGTVRLIQLFSVLFHNKEKVFVIDEIDRSLHPLLTFNFIESFKKQQTNNQLVVTTHEDYVLNLNLLRRDEIWFVEKNNDGNSKIYSLEEFKERFDKSISTAYLNGRYGGIPNLSHLFSEAVKN